jgi:hypothetical protein
MLRARAGSLIVCPALLLLAAEPVWKKPIPNWTENDAREILANSPWAKTAIAAIAPSRGEDQLRDGGAMGPPHGIGFDGIADRPRPKLPKSIFRNDETPPSAPAQSIHLLVRWDSALPVRAAVLKSHDAGMPALSEDGYTIGVYGIPGAYFGDPKKLGDLLRNFAFLRHEGKKDVKPSSAEVYQLERGAAVLYTFPHSPNITAQDGTIEFTAVIGRLKVSEVFKLEEMLIQNRLEL